MATVKKGMLTVAGEWWKHLRGTKRAFWKGERRAAKKDLAKRSQELGRDRNQDQARVRSADWKR
jgi:hypothetical protein